MNITEVTSIPEISSDHNPVCSLWGRLFEPPLQDEVNLFVDSMKSSFKGNPASFDDFIEYVEDYLGRRIRCYTAPLTFTQEVSDIILNYPNNKAARKDDIKNVAVKTRGVLVDPVHESEAKPDLEIDTSKSGNHRHVQSKTSCLPPEYVNFGIEPDLWTYASVI
ncbi:hypothetical protein TNCT_82371 [Trichonephila clavata]|uniref:Uncharacterized protein n=1 Tax=Trichonephila clavata TaxID=2740835 RepID=A0A8X6GUK6_TRICU|nr:hypothetical protein TNCT_82371 [Trichonephila clavata]